MTLQPHAPVKGELISQPRRPSLDITQPPPPPRSTTLHQVRCIRQHALLPPPPPPSTCLRQALQLAEHNPWLPLFCHDAQQGVVDCHEKGGLLGAPQEPALCQAAQLAGRQLQQEVGREGRAGEGREYQGFQSVWCAARCQGCLVACTVKVSKCEGTPYPHLCSPIDC